VDVGLSARFVVPDEGAVTKVNLDAVLREEVRPEHAHLLALRDRVGRDEGAADRGVLDVLGGLYVPRGHVVEQAVGFDVAADK